MRSFRYVRGELASVLQRPGYLSIRSNKRVKGRSHRMNMMGHEYGAWLVAVLVMQ